MHEVIELLKRKSEKASFETKIEENQGEFSKKICLILQIPEARGKRETRIYGVENVGDENAELQNESLLRTIAESNFHLYRFIEDYEAVWSRDLGTVECKLSIARSLQGNIEPRHREKLLSLLGSDPQKTTRVQLPSPQDTVSISIGKAGVEYSVFCEYITAYQDDFAKDTTIRIEGLTINTQDQARDLLLQIANSVLFQIEQKSGLCFYPTFKLGGGYSGPSWDKMEKIIDLQAPKYKYDNESMALYWHARSAWNAPSLQFLAYYQILEYYFPRYAKSEAYKAIANVLKQPTFNADSPSDLGRLLNAIGGSAWARGKEKDQLRATLAACVSIQDIRNYIEMDDKTKDFLRSKEARKVADPTISLQATDEELLGTIVNRLYNLRCRVVHTKDRDDDLRPLVPFSPEVRLMQADIQLISFLATRVISSSSEKLSI